MGNLEWRKSFPSDSGRIQNDEPASQLYCEA
jgi:hypothetical protein